MLSLLRIKSTTHVMSNWQKTEKDSSKERKVTRSSRRFSFVWVGARAPTSYYTTARSVARIAMLQPFEFVSRYYIAPWERLFACFPWVHGANRRMANRSPARAPLPDAVPQLRLQGILSLLACFRALQTLLDCSRGRLTSLRATLWEAKDSKFQAAGPHTAVHCRASSIAA